MVRSTAPAWDKIVPSLVAPLRLALRAQGRRDGPGGRGGVEEDGSVEFKTDTTVSGGTWDEAAVLTGFTFAAVKKDVFMKMDLLVRRPGKPRPVSSTARSLVG